MDPLNIAPFGQIMQQQPVDLPGMAQPKGMFGGGGWKDALLAAAAGYLGRRNPGAAQGLFHMIQQKQQQALEEAQYQRQRQDKFGDWRQQYDYELGHPKPTNNDTVADYDFWKRTLPPDQFNEWLQNKINPPQIMNLPGVGIVQVPRQAPQGTPTAPVGKLTPLGAGGPAPGPGGFQY